MRIVIVGGGKVGFTLAENLSADNHDIYFIDTDESVLKKADDMLDVMCIRGNGASLSTLKSAGIESADVLIAVTDRDELNMLSCLMAKKLGAKYTIARIRDPEYSDEAIHIKHELDIDMIINPENTTAMRIARIIRFPEAIDVDVFYRGRIELVGFRVEEGDIICGRPLSEVRKKLGNLPILFCAVDHGEETVIPNGSTVFEIGDKVYVIGEIINVNKFFHTLGRITHKAKNIFIAGGGRVGHYLGRSLSDMGMDIKIIEQDRARCEDLCELLPKALLVCGDGTDQELLASENLDKAAVFVSLTGRDEDNLIMSLYAKSAGVPKVIAKVARQNYMDLVDDLNIDSIVSPKMITAYSIIRKIRAMSNTQGSHMEALFQIATGSAEAIEFVVRAGAKNLGIALKDLKIKKGVLISVIVRNGHFIIPSGNDYIQEGDNVIIVTTSRVPILNLNDIYEN